MKFSFIIGRTFSWRINSGEKNIDGLQSFRSFHVSKQNCQKLGPLFVLLVIQQVYILSAPTHLTIVIQ